jgi:hypothetical protein
MADPKFGYQLEAPYSRPAGRLLEKYRIDIKKYITAVTDVGRNEQEGFWFLTDNSDELVKALMDTKVFIHDNRTDPFHNLAASATKGEGYREVSEQSLHFQISKGLVNVHLDHTGFVWRGPDGKTYIGPDAIHHILDELKWAEAVAWVSKKNKFFGQILDRMHPELPRTANKFIPQIGARFDIARGINHRTSESWSLSVNLKWGCSDNACSRTEMLTGLNFTYRNK